MKLRLISLSLLLALGLLAAKRRMDAAQLSPTPASLRTAHASAAARAEATVQAPSPAPRQPRAQRSFLQQMDDYPILEQQRGYTAEANRAYIDQLIYRSDFRFPYLIRRLFDDGSGQLAEGRSSLVEVQVASQFMIQVEKDLKFSLDSLPSELRSGVEISPIMEGSYVLSFALKNLEQRAALQLALGALSGVSGVFNDTLQYADDLPDDTYLPYLWSFQNRGVNPFNNGKFFSEGTDSGVAAAWEHGTDCSRIPIAVIDSGIDAEHPDLKGNILRQEGRSFVKGSVNFDDEFFHGTHVAGIIAATGNNKLGISGVCWTAEIIPIKVLDGKGVGVVSQIIAGLDYAVKSSARIANLSLGSGVPLPKTEEPDNFPYLVAVRAFEKAGKLLVATASNTGANLDENDYYPGTLETDAMITVGAINADGSRASFSGYGQPVDIVAPGVDILSTWPTRVAIPETSLLSTRGPAVSGYGVMSGTSMAVPLVTGVLALYWNQLPQLSATEVRRTLLADSRRSSYDLQTAGNRVIDAAKLLSSKPSQVTVAGSPGDATRRRGETYTLRLSLPEPSVNGISKVAVLYGDQVLVSAAGLVPEISFLLPDDPDPILIIRVYDGAGRGYDMDPFSVRLGVTLTQLLNFDQLPLMPGGNSLCRLSFRSGLQAIKLRDFGVDTPQICQKLCDIIKPLLRSKDQSILCGLATPG